MSVTRGAIVVLALFAACARKPDYKLTGTAGKGGAGTGRGGASGNVGTGGGGSGGNAGAGVAGSGGTAVAGSGGSAGAGGVGSGGNAGAGVAGSGGRGGSGVGGSAGGAGQGGQSGRGGQGGTGGVLAPGSGVLQHHNHASRDGVYVDAALTRTAVAALHIDPTFSTPAIDGPVYAQPLYLDGVVGKPDLVFVVTKTNHVYALNGATGALAWDVVVGPPAVRPATTCTPGAVGIIGTPIIDGARRIIYFDGMTAVANGDGGSVNKHLVYALDADTGAPRPGWPVDVGAKARSGTLAFDSTDQNQRGALALVGGTVYIPYGGFGGDCGAYHGWVVGISTDDPTHVIAWATRATLAGIWAPGGIAFDGTSLFVTTGNAVNGTTPWQDSEALIRLPLSLQPSSSPADYYGPTNWMAMDTADLDLGGTGPLPITVKGATPSELVVALGKDQRAYVVDRANLGGIGDPLIGAQVAGEGIVTAPAAYTTPKGTFVAFRGFGNACNLVALGHTSVFTITPTAPPTLKMVWCGGPKSVTAPAVSMTDATGANAIIWTVGTDYLLHGDDAETGDELFAGGPPATSTLGGVQKWQTAIVAHGRVFVAGSQVYAFTTK